MIAACIGITIERKITSSSSAESRITIEKNSGSLPPSTCEKSIEPAVNPPTRTVMPVRRCKRRQHVVAQVVDQVGGRERLRRRVGIRLDHRDGAGRRDPRLGDGDDAGGRAESSPQRGQRRVRVAGR